MGDILPSCERPGEALRPSPGQYKPHTGQAPRGQPIFPPSHLGHGPSRASPKTKLGDQQQQQQQNGGEREQRPGGRRGCPALHGLPWENRLAARDGSHVVEVISGGLAGLLLVVLFVVVVGGAVRGAAAAGPQSVGPEAQASHVLLDRLADGPLQPVAYAVVEQQRLGHGQHVLDDGSALLGAAQAVEELAAERHVAAERHAAPAVPVAAPPRLRAADHAAARSPAARAAAAAARPRQTRLDSALGGAALLVLVAVAVLQCRAPPGVVELDERRNAVARAPPPIGEGGGGRRRGGKAVPLGHEHRRARLGVLAVSVAAVRLFLALQHRLPADQAPAVNSQRRRGGAQQQHQQPQPQGGQLREQRGP